MHEIYIIGCGFVADFYMRSLSQYDDIKVAGVFDIDEERLEVFCAYWDVPKAASQADILARAVPGSLFLNLTNPGKHAEVSVACLRAGHHVYSEKPLATEMDAAHALHTLAVEKGLLLASAPCSVLAEAAQTLWAALRAGVAGVPRLVYAELDDDFVPQAPYEHWLSESGKPWPFEDEFRVGCTLEHAGYYLAWLIAMFGPVKTVAAASADLIPDKLAEGDTAPDFSVGVLFFESGVVARLTCSIIAPHDHQLRIFCDGGILELKEAWNNFSPVKFRRRFRIRRRLITHPIGRRIKLKGPTHPKGGKSGSACMNYALGPREMLEAVAEGRPCRLSTDFALHLNEVTLAIQNAHNRAGAAEMQTTCTPPQPMDWAVLA